MFTKKGGRTSPNLVELDEVGGGQPLTKALRELEQCGFVRRYQSPSKAKYGHLYQLIDPFSLFHLKFLDNTQIGSWLSYAGTQSHATWRGYAFELVCLLHINQVKQALGISGVETCTYAWRSSAAKPAVQIDLVIDRRDDVINICEMKYTRSEFTIDSPYAHALQHKLEAFEQEVHPKKALHLTMITTEGIARNEYRDIVQRELEIDNLFA